MVSDSYTKYTSLMFKMTFLTILASVNYYYFLHTGAKPTCIGITSEIYLLYMVSWTIVIEQQEMPRFVIHIAFLGYANTEKYVV